MRPLFAIVLAPLCFAATPTDQTVQPFLSKNCYSCHNSKLKTADLDLEAEKTGEVWSRVLEKIRNGEMPPKGLPRPDATQAAAVTKWIEGELQRQEKAMKPDAGHITARRLNRAEYNNTVRDLLGVDLRPADDFPQDDSGFGFDNIGTVLSLSPVLMEKYMVTAEKMVHTALFGRDNMKPLVERYQPPYREYELTQKPEFGYDTTGLSMPQSLHWMHRFPVDGEYLIRLVPEGRRPTGSDPIEMGVWLDGKLVKTLVVDDAPQEGNTLDLFGMAKEFRMRVPAGEHWLAGTVLHIYEGLPKSYEGPKPSNLPEPPAPDISRFLKIPANATAEEAAKLRKEAQLKIALIRAPANRAYIHYVEVIGPYNQTKGASPESLAKIYTCGHLDGKHVAGCDRKIVAAMARRAFRRPVTQQEIAPYLKLIALTQKQGGTFADGIATAIEGLMVSPDFLFRVEKNPPVSADSVPVTPTELASRLSYFLWSSMPDEELLRASEAGTLRKPEVLEAQVRRMLKDPKANALVENFAGQWLELRRLESAVPDRDKFPQFEEYLRISMRKESELFFGNIMRQDRSVLEMLDAKYTFLNQRLAEFYGIKTVKGPEFRQVDLTGTHRGGILTQASVLTASSYATRTSPVLRGKWVLENLLNAPPPPPPPNVPPLEEAKAGTSASLRQVMEAHRANALCASCHSKMDPLGFGLENYNAIGEWRDQDGKFPIDSSGVLPDGRTFKGPEELKAILLSNKAAFADCITEKMLTYALGRGLEGYDRAAVKEIVNGLAANDYKFSTLVMGIVRSMPFQMKRGEKNKT